MKKIFLFATMFAVSLSMLAQEYMHVWQDGKKTDYVVTEVDSVTFNKMMHNGHEYVDLGLPSGTLWAICHVGATKPEEYGDYFAWGETQPKDYYDWSTYKWCNGSFNTQTKYNTNSSYGTVDNKTTLDLSDDAARANWGGSWRMPTDAELTELREQCTWTWSTQNGVYGNKVTSKKSGYTNKSIFLPAAGVRDSSLIDAGSYGSYWSSSLYADYPYGAWGVYFLSDMDVSRGSGYRDYGLSVRPVCTQNSMSQREMYIWQNGGKTTFVVADVDSVTFSGSNLTNPTTPNGGIGVFSVGEGKTVTFSPGNLQYHPANDEWRFAENQRDRIHSGNEWIDSTYNGWIDLFGWGTGSNPTNRGWSCNDYQTVVDWSTNEIGTDAPNTWRTLSKDEWMYILYNRPNAQLLFAFSEIDLIGGLIILPDNWKTPEGVNFVASTTSGLNWQGSYYYNENKHDYFDNSYTIEQWLVLEKAGAVFLPTTGCIMQGHLNGTYCGHYWSNTMHNRCGAYSLDFNQYGLYPLGNYDTENNRNLGYAVRLVKDIKDNNEEGNKEDENASITGIENGYEYVDLGLSVKWATCNVGASKPEDYGKYFAWGETLEKITYYAFDTYKWWNDSEITKYCTNSRYGMVDNKTILDLSDDAAHVNWGGRWRMPTDAELIELRTECTWRFTTQNGVYGCKITSKINGNFIFLPAAGYRMTAWSDIADKIVSILSNAGTCSYYWSSSLDANRPDNALLVHFDASYVHSSKVRYHGCPVRPVCPQKN